MVRIALPDSPLSAKPSLTSLAGSAGRLPLGDITNVAANRQKALLKSVSEEERLALAVPIDTKDYARLLQENAALLKLLEERNGIIEYNNIELQKQKVTVQKLQQQNWQLAQSNSLMFAELKIATERMKALQHELSCSAAVLKTKTLELEELKEKMEMALGGHKIDGKQPLADDSQAIAERKPLSSRKRASTSQALCSSTLGDDQSAKNDDDQRRSIRRRSSSNLESQSSVPGISDLPKVEEPMDEDQPLYRDVKSSATDCKKGNNEQEIMNHTSSKLEQKQAKKLRHGRSVTKSQVNEPAAANLAEMVEEPPKEGMAMKEKSDLQSSTAKLREGKVQKLEIRSLPVQRTRGEKEERVIMRRAPRRLCDKGEKEHESTVRKNTKQCPIIIEDSPAGQRDYSSGTISCSGAEPTAENIDVAAASVADEDHQEQDRKSLPETMAMAIGTQPPAGRPSRRATIGVSYKERPLNVKMRRPE